MRRYYVRCRDCLAVAAVDAESERELAGAVCGCGGRIEVTGYVRRIDPWRLAAETWRPPCDARCTNASGPQCDCACGGEHHGTGRLVPVVRDAGGVPRLQAGDPTVAAEWRQAVEAARAVIERLPGAERARAGHRIARDDYLRLRKAVDLLSKARRYRTHKRRMQTIRQIIILEEETT